MCVSTNVIISHNTYRQLPPKAGKLIASLYLRKDLTQQFVSAYRNNAHSHVTASSREVREYWLTLAHTILVTSRVLLFLYAFFCLGSLSPHGVAARVCPQRYMFGGRNRGLCESCAQARSCFGYFCARCIVRSEHNSRLTTHMYRSNRACTRLEADRQQGRQRSCDSPQIFGISLTPFYCYDRKEVGLEPHTIALCRSFTSRGSTKSCPAPR